MPGKGEKDEGCKGEREAGAGRVAAVNEPHELQSCSPGQVVGKGKSGSCQQLRAFGEKEEETKRVEGWREWEGC